MQPPLLLGVHTRTITRLLAQTRTQRRSTHRGTRQRKRTPTITNGPVLVMTEAQFQAAVIQIARLNGWRVFHPKKMQGRDGTWRTALTGDNGWPDLVLAHPKRGLIVAELKADRGRLTQDQHAWIAALAPWAEIHVWRPADINTIAERLGSTPTQK